MQFFNPFRFFTGSFIPNAIMRDGNISPGAKLCYARLCQYADKNTGVAYPGQDALADELGASVRQVQRYIKELEDYGMLHVERPGLRKANRYRFLIHETVYQDTTDMSYPDTTDVSYPIGRESMEENQLDRKSGYTKSVPEELPDCIDPAKWDEWVQHRKELRKKLTERQAQKQVSKLESWAAEGYDPNQIIETSVTNGWQGLFKPKGETDAARGKSRTDDYIDETGKLVERIRKGEA